MLWLLPLLDPETEYIHRFGWEAFEENLIRIDPDVYDFRRAPMALKPPA